MVLVTTVAIGLANLLRPDPVPDLPHAGGLKQVRSIVKQSQRARANLALLGDKRFLFSDSGKAFIMYRVKGESGIALGDPVGPAAEHERLVLTFRELCDRYGGWPVFYLVDAEGLSLYVDLGLSPLKVGEDARVPLEAFSRSTGHARSELREAHDRVPEQGVNFGIVSPHEVPALIPEPEGCRTTGWRTWRRRSGASRGGSSARTTWPGSRARGAPGQAHYRVRGPLGQRGKEELALDLVRYHRDAPKGIVEFMVTELMVGGRARGYRWFDWAWYRWPGTNGNCRIRSGSGSAG